MCILPALLCVLLVTVPGSLSGRVERDAVKTTVRHIKNTAKTTLIRINEQRAELLQDLQINIPPPPTPPLPPPPFRGLTSTIHDLRLLDEELRSHFWTKLVQIEADVSSLTGMVHSLAMVMHCAEPGGPRGQAADYPFPEVQILVMLTKVERSMNKLLHRNNTFTVC